ncbi:hypothetical protein PAPYR_4215 [Paratrimastix pyriformis]|uniref:F-box domain-containing protein n=1 Tax=Paratrimastix pyriformis TaxID=342808 RepID=A0ABQ8UQK0_9EUKA|nr:hypothetical protein PAPYR_4215 [Paratrimastix pyriformis]
MDAPAAPFLGPSGFDMLPREILDLIGGFLIEQCLPSESGPTLVHCSLACHALRTTVWERDQLWRKAFETDFGEITARAVRKYPDRILPPEDRPKTRIRSLPPGPTPWRTLYGMNVPFLRMVRAERETKKQVFVAQKKLQPQYQPPNKTSLLLTGVLTPLTVIGALPALIVLLILRSELVIGWSFHIILVPADVTLVTVALYAIAMWSDMKKSCSTVLAIVPGIMATLHWAAARGDWTAVHGGSATPGVWLNWLLVMLPLGVVMLAILVIWLPFIYGASSDRLHWSFVWLAGLHVVAFLATLAIKMQYGERTFYFAYAFIPLFLVILLAVVYAMAMSKTQGNHPITIIGVAMLAMLPLTFLVLLVLRLDWGIPHAAFLAIPLGIMYLPVLAAGMAFCLQECAEYHRRSRTARIVPVLDAGELDQIESGLTAKYGVFIYPPGDGNLQYNRIVRRQYQQREGQIRRSKDARAAQMDRQRRRVLLEPVLP